MTRIAIILCSTGPGRNGEAVAGWVHEIAATRGDADFELVDIADYHLPHLDEAAHPSLGQYTHEHTKASAEDLVVAWSRALASLRTDVKQVVRRNTERVQSGGDFALFEELFADDFVDHTPQPGTTPDKNGVRVLYHALRSAFPDFTAKIHWQTADGDVVTTYKTYSGTHRGEFLGLAPTGEHVEFETVDAMRVRDGKITEHWGVANLYSVLQQLGALPGREGK